MLSTATHIVTGPGEGEVIEARGSRVVIKAATDGQLVCEYTAPPHFAGPPLHIHPGFDETFVMLDGTLEVRVGDEIAQLVPGASAFISGEEPHTFANPSSQPGRFLVVCTPGGFEQYFRALAAGDEAMAAAVGQRFGYAPVAEAA